MTVLVNQVHSLLYFALIVVIFAGSYSYMLGELKHRSIGGKEDVTIERDTIRKKGGHKQDDGLHE